MKLRFPFMLTITIAALLATSTLVFAAEESKDKPAAQTTANPDIPADELALMLHPFTKAELLIEADGWQALVREKAVSISKAEIAVKRQSIEIAKTKEIQNQVEDAKEELQQVKENTESAQESGDAAAMQDAEKAAQKAQEKIATVQQTVTEAADAAEKTAEMYDKMSDETKQGIEETVAAADKAQDAVQKVKSAVSDAAGKKDVNEVKKAAAEAHTVTTDAQQAADKVTTKTKMTAVALEADRSNVLEDTAKAMEDARAEKKDEKIDMLELVNSLRLERIKLVDNFRTTVDELASRTDKDDSKTLAVIKDYRLYIRSVSGINLDLTDTTSSWVIIKGWILSEEGGMRWVKNLAVFFGILFGAWFLARFISWLMHRAMNRVQLPQLLEQFLVKAVRWVVMIAGIIVALTALEISVAPLLALVGAAGFIIAFALQDSLSNFASGLMILFFRPFDIDDLVEAGGVTGKVTSLNLLATTIRTADNKEMIVPNNAIFSNVITNSTSVDKRRVDMEFGIGYDDDIDQTLSILNDIVSNHPMVLKNPEPTIKVHTLADSSVNFICRPWTKSADYWDVYWDVTREVKKRFDAEGVGMPYPQQDVHLYVKDAEAMKA
ncbi:MAG: mechanosensitive ion channel [Thermodesulfobacteriota bacterium]|nr:mechanosensitive ion channel [Thermodesulfobacteriota bacterium]